MMPYRTAEPNPRLTMMGDPFPAILCINCGLETVSVNGEERCSRCDYDHLLLRSQQLDPFVGRALAGLFLAVLVGRFVVEHAWRLVRP